MKVKELMVDDFVKFGKRILRCKNILGHTNDVMLENGVITNVMNIEPIPLTKEILEKNGFEKSLQVSDTEPFDIDEEGNKHYSYNGTFWGWWQQDNILCIPANGLGWLNIKYVHQLQNALRLCGIEDIIRV